MKQAIASLLRASFLLLIVTELVHAERIVVVTGDISQRVLSFDSSHPATVSQARVITGFVNSFEQFVSIDFRPATGQLYGLTHFSRLYRLDPVTGVATFIPTQISMFNFSDMVGIDFNPVTDELRMVNQADQNFRVNVDTGVVIQENSVSFAMGDPRFPSDPTIPSIAYTHSRPGASSTTLYGIDTNSRILVTQGPEAQGLLHTIGPLLVAPLNQSFLGFDISGCSGIAYATFITTDRNPLEFNQLYTIDLNTGRATAIGLIGDGSFSVIALAVSTGMLFDLCLQDDSNGNILQISTSTGEYQFTSGSGLFIEGICTLTRRGSVINFQQTASDRRIRASFDGSSNRASASIQLLSPSTTFSILDRNTADNSCACR
jgi:hypothetical protein